MSGIRAVRLKWHNSMQAILKDRQGQMAVEMAVMLPVMLVLVFVAFNVLNFLSVCARFDPLTADAVRTQAASPGSGQYGREARADLVRAILSESFADSNEVTITVEAQQLEWGGSAGDAQGGDTSGVTIPFLPHQEVFICTLHYQPFGANARFFGLSLPAVSHERRLVIDPYRPGVLF